MYLPLSPFLLYQVSQGLHLIPASPLSSVFSACSASAAAAGSFAASTINGLLALAHEPQSIYARQSLDPSTLPAAVSLQISLVHCLVAAHMHFCHIVQISLRSDLYHLECAFRASSLYANVRCSRSDCHIPQDCTTAACTCTITNGDELEGCINCLVSLSPITSQIQLGQEVLNSRRMFVVIVS